jgi:recombination protein RecA
MTKAAKPKEEPADVDPLDEGQAKGKSAFMHPALAAAEAFSEMKDLDCINLMKGRRVSDVISTGSLVLDLILGGGFARGRFGTIFGPEASGKSTILQQMVVMAQQLGIPVVFYDPEAGADPVYMATQGVNLKYELSIKNNKKTLKAPGFFYTQPDTGQQVYQHMLRTMSKMQDVDSGLPTILFLVDSFEAMTSDEVDQETGEGARLGSQARMHSFYLRMITPKLRRKGAVLVGSNQMRTAIGTYGNPERESGGNALKYYAHYKVKTSRKQVIADKTKIMGLPVLWRTVKNKAFPPFRSTDMSIILGRGIDMAFDAHYFFTQLGLMTIKNGRRQLNLKGLQDRFYSWGEFRQLTENPKFRARCFEMLKDNGTYERYFQHSGEATYFYDRDYDYSGADVAKLEQATKEEAEEYQDDQQANRRKGRRPDGVGKQEDNANLQLIEEALDESQGEQDQQPFEG